MGARKEIEPVYKHTVVAHNKQAAEVVLPWLFKIIQPSSLLDIGCGLGSWIAVANDLGVKDCLGIDGDHVDFTKLFIPKDRILIHDLMKPINLGKKYDLVLCLEVAEHLPEAAADTLIQTATSHSEIVLFSAAVPGQGGQNHLNEKSLSYWVQKFKKHDYTLFDFIRPIVWNNPKVDVWYRQNLAIFCKRGHPLEEILRPISSPYVDIIHPELFQFYSYQAARAALYEEGKLGVKSSFSAFIKSIVNKVK